MIYDFKTNDKKWQDIWDEKEAFKAYSEGMELLQFCNASIDTVEKKVLKMNENGETDEF